MCVSFAFNVLKRFLPEEKVEGVQGLALTADGKGAVFDVPAGDLDTFLAGKDHLRSVQWVHCNCVLNLFITLFAAKGCIFLHRYLCDY